MAISPTAVENTSLVNFWTVDGSVIADKDSLLKGLVVEGYLEDSIILQNLSSFNFGRSPSLGECRCNSFFFAWNIYLRGLLELWEFDTLYPCLYVADGLEIKGVGFGSIDNIVLRSPPKPSVFSMGGILNVNNLSFTSGRSTKTQINRNGNISMLFDC